jgi:hypothetical protein
MDVYQTNQHLAHGGNQARTNVAHSKLVEGIEPRIGQLEEIEAKFSHSLNHLHDIICRCRSVSDRLLGSIPEPVEKSASTPPAKPPVVQRLENMSSYFVADISLLSSLLERLERL